MYDRVSWSFFSCAVRKNVVVFFSGKARARSYITSTMGDQSQASMVVKWQHQVIPHAHPAIAYCSVSAVLVLSRALCPSDLHVSHSSDLLFRGVLSASRFHGHLLALPPVCSSPIFTSNGVWSFQRRRVSSVSILSWSKSVKQATKRVIWIIPSKANGRLEFTAPNI